MKLSESLRSLGPVVAYYPSIAKLVGVKECVLLCQLVWWAGKQADPEGWIYKTQTELTDETGLSRWEQETARKTLRNLKVLEERDDRLAHKLFYRINLTVLDAIWNEQRIPECGSTTSGKEEMPHSSKVETPHPTYKAGDHQESTNRRRDSSSLEEIKERYEHLTLNTLNISLYDVQSTIVEWLKHYTVEDLVLTLGYLKREIKAGTRQRGALNFRNIFDPTKFMDDLSMAKGVARVKKVDPARESVLKAAGFPVEAPSNPVKTPKDSLEKIQAGWKTVLGATQ